MAVRWAGNTAVVAALLFAGVATAACAETPPAPPPTVNSQNPNAFGPPGTAPAASRKSLQWDTSGKWTLNLDMDEPVGRDLALKDVSAGAFFHITPSMRIGGSVDLGDRFADPEKILPEDTSNAPRVHLETKFKF